MFVCLPEPRGATAGCRGVRLPLGCLGLGRSFGAERASAFGITPSGARRSVWVPALQRQARSGGVWRGTGAEIAVVELR